MNVHTGVVLIGHGATASDTPRELVAELKQLEGRRVANSGVPAPMSPRWARNQSTSTTMSSAGRAALAAYSASRIS